MGISIFTLKNVKYKGMLNIDYLEIPEGKITCIVGESGGGKTTLVKLLNNLISCEEGEILYKGTSIETLDPIQLRREIIMLPQTPLIFPGSIKNNLLIGLGFSEKEPVSEKRLNEVLQMIRVNKDLEADASYLSGGEKQRIALARILLMNPEVLLLDEPSSALDEDTEVYVIEKIINYMKERKKSLIMITHSKTLARTFGEKIIVLAEGRIIEVEEMPDK